jgi:hypothetical protein
MPRILQRSSVGCRLVVLCRMNDIVCQSRQLSYARSPADGWPELERSGRPLASLPTVVGRSQLEQPHRQWTLPAGTVEAQRPERDSPAGVEGSGGVLLSNQAAFLVISIR